MRTSSSNMDIIGIGAVFCGIYRLIRRLMGEMKLEYRKITPQEAESRMGEGVIILDVRTQEEFDTGHIKNASLLPDHEIKEKAEAMLGDKSQTVLVYCRTGRRSEAVAKELIAMGYADVYDFGGIADWTGEIVK